MLEKSDANGFFFNSNKFPFNTKPFCLGFDGRPLKKRWQSYNHFWAKLQSLSEALQAEMKAENYFTFKLHNKLLPPC